MVAKRRRIMSDHDQLYAKQPDDLINWGANDITGGVATFYEKLPTLSEQRVKCGLPQLPQPGYVGSMRICCSIEF